MIPVAAPFPARPPAPNREPLATVLLGVWQRFGIRGVAGEERRRMGMYCAPDASAAEVHALMEAGAATPQYPDEFDELVALLWDHRCDDCAQTRWLACAMASACFGADHLWQDMGLPSRTVLSELMSSYFPGLYAKNTQNMKWKKFFYKQLCDRMGLNLCKAPSCSECTDFGRCFGPEE